MLYYQTESKTHQETVEKFDQEKLELNAEVEKRDKDKEELLEEIERLRKEPVVSVLPAPMAISTTDTVDNSSIQRAEPEVITEKVIVGELN